MGLSPGHTIPASRCSRPSGGERKGNAFCDALEERPEQGDIASVMRSQREEPLALLKKARDGFPKKATSDQSATRSLLRSPSSRQSVRTGPAGPASAGCGLLADMVQRREALPSPYVTLRLISQPFARPRRAFSQ